MEKCKRMKSHSVCQRVGYILDNESLEDTPAVLLHRKLCEDHGYSCEWTQWPKPHLIHKGTNIQCNMEDYVPVVVLCQPDLPARLRVHPQHRYRRTQCETILRQVQQPHEARVHAVEYWETSCEVPPKKKTKITMRTPTQHWEARCVICWNGWRNSLLIQWTTEDRERLKGTDGRGMISKCG